MTKGLWLRGLLYLFKKKSNIRMKGTKFDSKMKMIAVLYLLFENRKP